MKKSENLVSLTLELTESELNTILSGLRIYRSNFSQSEVMSEIGKSAFKKVWDAKESIEKEIV